MSAPCIAPDQETRDLALDPTGSFLVQAPAGSGKTGLLTQRYLTLLATVCEPEEILAITFTRKAAGEMRDRLVRSLARAAAPPPEDAFARRTWSLAREVLEQDRRRGWGLTDNPSRLRIQTIDSLCHGLARQMPVLSQFGSPLEAVEDAQELYLKAAREALKHLDSQTRWAPAVERLLRHLDNDLVRVERLVAEMLSRRDQWLRHVAPPERSRLRPVLEEGLVRALSEELGTLRALFPGSAVQELLEMARYALSQGNLELAPLGERRTLPGDRPEDLPAWVALTGLLLTASGEFRRRVDQRQGFPAAGKGPGSLERKLYKERFGALCLDLAEIEDLSRRLAGVRRLPPPAYEDRQWEVLEAFFEVLMLATAQLTLVFREAGRCDFTEFSLKAVEALGPEDAPTDLALALDHRIRHLLVDEYQDTSTSQDRLLRCLTAGWEPGDGRTLFLVGDPMQSIYRFRDAEVGLFLRARDEGLGALPLRALSLTSNFRSQAALVDWFNQCFSRVFPHTEDRNTGAICYSVATASRPALPGPGVLVHPLYEEDPRVEAAEVVKVIQEERSADPHARLVVLVRSREHLREILPALRQADQPFQAVELEKLDTRPVVQDLLALTRTLLHAGDRVAWLAVLRAPWCGLTLHDLTLLAAGEEAALPDLLADPVALDRLSPDARARAGRVHDILQEAWSSRRRQPLRRWVEGTWMALGGPACLAQPGDLEDALAYLAILDGFDERSEWPDVADLNSRLRRLFARPDPSAGPRLQVMTIHRAKGLEFDVVLLPGLGRRTRRPGQPLMLWAERLNQVGTTDLLLGPITEIGRDRDPVYSWLADVEARREVNETSRLLYVAATRAIRRLHLFGQVDRDAETGEVAEPPEGTMLGLLWPVVAADFAPGQAGPEACLLPAEEPPPPIPGTTFDEEDPLADPLPPLRRLEAEPRLPEPPPAVALRPQRDETLEEAPEFRWASETVRHVGTLVHRVLRSISHEGLAAWDASRLETMPGALRAALVRLGVPQDELQAGTRAAMQALSGLLDCPRGRWILDPAHREARSEYALAGRLHGRVVRVQVDRTFVDDQGVRWIVDYKTGTHEGGDLEAFLDSEQQRYRPQMERYARLMQRLDPRPLRLGLYFPLLRGWREWSPES